MIYLKIKIEISEKNYDNLKALLGGENKAENVIEELRFWIENEIEKGNVDFKAEI